jgi:hypothetical protein
MQDQRITFFRSTLEALVESLDATSRLSRWNNDEVAPEPLRMSAAKLAERLGTANRLATGQFVGADRVVKSLSGMSGAIKRLDAAYVHYRASIESKPAERDEAAAQLDAEIGLVKAEVEALI